jgi:hypothetical protein
MSSFDEEVVSKWRQDWIDSNRDYSKVAPDQASNLLEVAIKYLDEEYILLKRSEEAIEQAKKNIAILLDRIHKLRKI